MTKKEKAFELGWKVGHEQTKEDYKDLMVKILGDIEAELLILRASISLTHGMVARKMAKKLLDKINTYKGGKND